MWKLIDQFFAQRVELLRAGKSVEAALQHALPTAIYSTDDIEVFTSLSRMSARIDTCRSQLLANGAANFRHRLVAVGIQRGNVVKAHVVFESVSARGAVAASMPVVYLLRVLPNGTFRIELVETPETFEARELEDAGGA